MSRATGQGGIDYQDGGFASGANVYAVVGDIGEIAARLKSPVNFDRRGTVFHIDDFEGGITGWTEALTGSGRELMTSAKYTRTGSYSMKVVPASAIPYNHVISRKTVYPHAGKLGLELAFPVCSGTQYIQIDESFYDGATLHYTSVKYHHVDDELSYLDEDGNWQVLGSGFSLLEDYTVFHVLKFVVDSENDQYTRFLLDANSWENLEYPCQAIESTLSPHIKIWVRVFAIDNSQPVHHFDGFILTQNEP